MPKKSSNPKDAISKESQNSSAEKDFVSSNDQSDSKFENLIRYLEGER